MKILYASVFVDGKCIGSVVCSDDLMLLPFKHDTIPSEWEQKSVIMVEATANYRKGLGVSLQRIDVNKLISNVKRRKGREKNESSINV